MSVLDKFLDYVTYDTKSDEETGTVPSTPGQKVFGAHLVDEMKKIGISNAFMNDMGYVYGSIASNSDIKTKIGFLAHMDTSPEISGKNVRPRIIENYDGSDIVLCDGVIMKVKDFPNLSSHIGKKLVVTDGTTLLGGDDKAGVAEILEACEEIIASDMPHGEIKIAFTPDEEIGEGPDNFDVEGFDADYAYTLDGGELGGIDYENFNAASAKVYVKGKSVHPGSAKNKMTNAMMVAIEFASMLPENETPEHTEGYEGFNHLVSMKGDIENAELHYIIRDHDLELLEKKKQRFLTIAEYLNNKYEIKPVTVELKDSYRNMKEVILLHPEIIEQAKNAMTENGVTPVVSPIRGGTDGARLSFMGLPCPNLCTGGENAHGKYEFVDADDMEIIKNIVISIVRSTK